MEAPSPETVRSTIDEVLANPEYEAELRTVTGPEGLVEVLVDLLVRSLDWVGSLFDGLQGLQQTQPFIYWAILIASAMLLGLLLWYIAQAVLSVFRPDRYAEEFEDAAESDPSLPFRELWAASREAEAQGDHGEALHLLLLALLARLEERRIPRLVGWTNREIVEHLPLDDARRRPLHEFVTRVDHFWYGGAQISQEDYRSSVTIVHEYLKGTESL